MLRKMNVLRRWMPVLFTCLVIGMAAVSVSACFGGPFGGNGHIGP